MEHFAKLMQGLPHEVTMVLARYVRDMLGHEPFPRDRADIVADTLLQLPPLLASILVRRFLVRTAGVPAVVTVLEPPDTRSRDGPMAFLESFTGFLQADAYSGYDALYATGRVVEVACWAHTRRKFHESRETDPTRAHTALAMIGLLYQVEDEAKDLSSSERRSLCQERSKPRLGQIKEWLEKEQVAVLPKSPIGQAISYALSNWRALTRYIDDGDLHIDNNPAENAIRPIVLGRRNWLFAGSDNGGRTAAVLSSFVASCRRQEIDPFAYLRDVLTNFAACPINEIDQFLPDRWHAARVTKGS